jgi:hypothetical protein
LRKTLSDRERPKPLRPLALGRSVGCLLAK